MVCRRIVWIYDLEMAVMVERGVTVALVASVE
jgi:hypothetical protein